MKKGFTIFLILLAYLSTNAQKKIVEKAKDTVKTEVVIVVTKYNPEIADAKKIKKNPTIKLLKKSEKKKLEYTIYAAPVASTFIPKSGAVKGIAVGIKERIYNNYIAAGFGNYTKPFFETYLQHSTRFENEFGFSAKYLSSLDNIKNTTLNSNYSNFNAGVFYKEEDRYFDWKVSLNSERNEYNWYGLNETAFNETTTNAINEEQTYNYFELNGEFNFIDSYIDSSKLSISYFTDAYKSTEILANFDTRLDLPLSFIKTILNNIAIKTGVEFLKGEFRNSYKDENPVKYSIITAKVHPEYKLTYKDFTLNAGAKIFVSLDTENDATNFFVFPNIIARKPIVKKYLNIYGGISGDLHTNTYRSFTEENPYVSPTLFITQTDEKSNFFIGFNGKITNDISYNLEVSAKSEEDKPLFLRNNSKSDGTTSNANNTPLKGYEYGNSFSVYYDDVKTNSLFAELEYEFTKSITFGTKFHYNDYTITNALEKWNLPALEASFFGKYKKEKWYATTNIFYISERKDGVYNAQFPSSFKGIETINSYIDVNLNGGYHFNDKFAAFLKLNNILNNDYQRFANFTVQGFQVLGGITYKFDF